MLQSNKCQFIECFAGFISDCKSLICDFHREQAWDRWVKNSRHQVSSEDQLPLLDKLRSIATATTEESYETAVHALQASPIWEKNRQLQSWFQTRWLNHSSVSFLSRQVLFFTKSSTTVVYLQE